MEQKFLIELLKEAVSPFQCVEASVKRLKQDGFEEITYEEKWTLKFVSKLKKELEERNKYMWKEVWKDKLEKNLK